MNIRKTVTIGLAIIAVCLLVSGIGMFLERSVQRDPTPEEMAACAPYDPGRTKAELMAVCTFAENAVIGQNEYRTYTSESLPGLLYDCAPGSIERIAEDGNGIFYVQYSDSTGHSVTLAYDDTALLELAVYDTNTDLMFVRQGDTATVWERFRTGVHLG